MSSVKIKLVSRITFIRDINKDTQKTVSHSHSDLMASHSLQTRPPLTVGFGQFWSGAV